MKSWLIAKLSRPTRPACSVRMLHTGDVFSVASDETLLEAALRAGIDFPHHCRIGSCGECRCRVKHGRFKTAMDLGYVLTADQIAAGQTLACQTRPSTDLDIEVIQDEQPNSSEVARTYEATVSSLRALAPDIVELRVDLNGEVEYKAGQYAFVEVPGRVARRAYSMASAPENRGQSTLSFHVRLLPQGGMSDWLRNGGAVGYPLRITGPLGCFRLPAGTTPVICIAGGSAMGVMLAILEDAWRHGSRRDVTYIYLARTKARLYSREVVEELADKWRGRFAYAPQVTQTPEVAAKLAMRMATKSILTEVLATEVFATEEAVSRSAGSSKAARDHVALLCGATALVETARSVLLEAGIGSSNVYYDSFMPLA